MSQSTLSIRTIYDNATGTPTPTLAEGSNAILQHSDVKMEFFLGTSYSTYLPYRLQRSSYYSWWGSYSGSANGFVAAGQFPCIGSKISGTSADEGDTQPNWLSFHPINGSYSDNTKKLVIKITPQNYTRITGYTLWYQDQNAIAGGTTNTSVRIGTGQNATQHQYTRIFGNETSASAGSVWTYIGSYENYPRVSRYIKDISSNPVTSNDFLYVTIDDAEDPSAYAADAGTIKMVLNTEIVIPQLTMTITSTTVTSGSTTKNASIALTFTSSSSTSDFALEDISFTNGANGTLSDFAGSGTVYTATFTPADQGLCTIDVSANKFTANGQNNNASNTFTWTFDSISPSMTIESTTSGVTTGSTTNNTSIALTFTSTEATNNFAVGDISVTNGSLSAFTAVSSTVYTATFTPTTAGLCTIDVSAGVYTDAATNVNNLATQFTWTFDNVPPTMTIESTTAGVSSGSTTNNASIALRFTSSKATNNFAVGDISVTNGTITNFNSSSSTVYTATFTPADQGACTIDVSGGVFTDAVGNNNTAATQFTWTYDRDTPGMTITSTTSGVTSGSTTNNATIALTFTASASTSDFTVDDITVTNGTLSSPLGGSGSVYTATFTPTNQGLCTIDVSSNKFTYAAGNSNNASNTFTWTFDSFSPTMLIESTTAGVTNGSTTNQAIALRFTSSEATTNFAVGDISVTNGTLSNFAASSSTVYTATFTPAGQGTCTIDVASGAYTDAVGNNNSASTFSVYYIPNFAAFNNANNLEQTYITGFLDVSGNVNHRNRDLNVMDGNLLVTSGNVSFNNGNLYVGGNGVINSGLAVSGSTTLGRASVSNNMDVSGATNLVGALAISGLTSFNNNVSVSSNKTFTVGTGATAMGGSATMNSTLAVAGGVSMKSGLRVAGATTLANAIMDGPVSVSGRVVFLNDISFTGPNIDICGNLRAQYPANSIPAAAIIGGISVVNLFNNDVSLSQTLSVGGATSLSTLAATGNATLRSTVGIAGATTMSALTTSGATTAGGALSVVGKAALTNDVSFNGPSRIDICGNLYANYPANSIPASAVVGGGVNPVFMTDVSVNAAISAAGATTLQSTLVVSGQTTLANDVSFNGSRIDICGNLYAKYPANSIPSAAIIGGTTVSSTFNTDVSMNSRLYVKENIKIGNLATVRPMQEWYQNGGSILPEMSESAFFISLSADGNVVAIGSSTNTGNGSGSGHVRVYKYDATKLTADTNQNNATFGPVGWNRLGADIDGESTNDYSGAVSVVSDGTNIYVAIGAGGNVGNKGHVRVYQYVEGKAANAIDSSDQFGPAGWKRLGADIDGEASDDRSCWTSLSYSANGLIVAIGATNNDGTNTGNTADNRGHVRVYKYRANKLAAVIDQSLATFGPIGWDRLGKDIDGEAFNDQSGWSVALSADGTVLAVGASLNDGTTTNTGDNRGHVRVYEYVSGTNIWSQLGGDIDGEAPGDISGDQTGTRVSLVKDGTNIFVAIGANGNDGTTTSTGDRGHVRVYQRNAANTTIAPIGWTQLGGDIDGEAPGDNSGFSVSLSYSANGLIVAISGHENDGTTTNTSDARGHVRVYKYDATKTNAITDQSSLTFGPVGWNRLGQDIDGEAASNRFGIRLSLSSDGYTVAVASGTSSYAAKVFKIGDIRLSTSVLSTSGLQTAGAAAISGPLAVTGATTLLSTMNATGAASMTSLNITGATTLNSTMTVSGSATIGGTLLVTGTSSIGVSTMNSTFSVGAATTMSTKLVANSDVSLNNKLTVTGATTMNSTLTVAGATTLNNTAFMTSLVTAGAVTQSTLYVAKSVTINGDLDTSGVLLMSAVTMPSTLTVAGAATLSSQLSVAGATTMRSTLNTTGAVTIGGILSVSGAITISGAANMNGKVSVGSDVSMNSTLTVANNATLASTLAVVGASTLSSTLYISGSTTINNTLNVNGKTTFLNDVSFNNNVTTPNRLNMNNNRITIGSSNIQYNAGVSIDSAVIPTAMYTTNNATVGGVLTIAGSTTLSSTLTVGGAVTSANVYASSNATLGSTLSVAGAATVGPLTVSGATTVSTMTTTGAATVGGTLGIAGASTMTTLNIYGPMRQW